MQTHQLPNSARVFLQAHIPAGIPLIQLTASLGCGTPWCPASGCHAQRRKWGLRSLPLPGFQHVHVKGRLRSLPGQGLARNQAGKPTPQLDFSSPGQALTVHQSGINTFQHTLPSLLQPANEP